MPEDNNMEQNPGGKNPQSGEPKPIRKNSRLKFAARRGIEYVVHHPEVEGLEYLAEIPQNQAVVWGTSHLTDVDWAAVTDTLSSYRNLKVASLKTNRGDPFQGGPMMVIEAGGEKIFLDVENTFDKKKNLPRMKFNRENFERMDTEMSKGNDIVIPVYDRTIYAQLPDGNAGIGGVYLAQLRGTPIVPVAFDIHSDKPVGQAIDMMGPGVGRFVSGKRPGATLRIGKPIHLESIGRTELEDAARLFTSVDRTVLRTDPEKFERAKLAYEKLKAQGVQVMNAVADLLPQEKRGKWGTKNDSSSPGKAI